MSSVSPAAITDIVDIGTGDPVLVADLAPNYPLNLDTPGERAETCADTLRMSQLGFNPKYNIREFIKTLPIK